MSKQIKISGFTDDDYEEALDRLRDRYLRSGGERYEELKDEYRRRKGYSRNAPGFTDSTEYRRARKNFADAARRLKYSFARGRVDDFLSGDQSHVKSSIPALLPTMFFTAIGDFADTFRQVQNSPLYQGRDVFAVQMDDFSANNSRGVRVYQDPFNVSMADRDMSRAAAREQSASGGYPMHEIFVLDDGMNVFVVGQWFV